MSDFDDLYTNLQSHVTALETKFLAGLLATPTVMPDEDFIKAYCILCHAAIEEFFEKTSLTVMTKCLDDWFANRKYRDTLVTLTCYYQLRLAVEDDEKKPETKVFDYLRPIFDEAKKKMSHDINENHGASVKYLRKLMIPVAISIKDDIKLASLKQLAKERGAYAHKQLITRVLGPEDARNYVKDCLEICDDIRKKANDKFV